MRRDHEIGRELLRRAAVGFPLGVALVYLVFLAGGAFVYPSPAGNSVPVVTKAMAEAWGSPVTAGFVQVFWSGLLGAVLETAEVPFRLERRMALWSALHFLLTAAVFSLAGRQCRWFPLRETWLCLLCLLLLCYLLMWAVRYLGWQADVRAIRRTVGLPAKPAGAGLRSALPYLLLAAGVEVLLPPILRLLDARDVPVLTGLFYPILILPLFCFFIGCSLGKRQRWAWLPYAAACAALTLPQIYLLYNTSALFQAWIAGGTALLGGLLGAAARHRKERREEPAHKTPDPPL